MWMKNKKAIASVFVFIIIILVLIGLYLVLFLPIPAFAKIRIIANYFLILIFWFLIQGLLVYGYYKLGILAIRGIKLYRVNIVNWALRVKEIIVSRR